jgi:hypothetical protein
MINARFKYVVAGFSPRSVETKMNIWTCIERGVKPATTYLAFRCVK